MLKFIHFSLYFLYGTLQGCCCVMNVLRVWKPADVLSSVKHYNLYCSVITESDILKRIGWIVFPPCISVRDTEFRAVQLARKNDFQSIRDLRSDGIWEVTLIRQTQSKLKSLCWIILITLSFSLFNPSINMCAILSPENFCSYVFRFLTSWRSNKQQFVMCYF